MPQTSRRPPNTRAGQAARRAARKGTGSRQIDGYLALKMLPGAAAADERLTRSDLRVFCWLVRRANIVGECFPSHREIAQALAYCRSSVQRSLHKLEALGYLSSRRRFDAVTSRETSKLYSLNLAYVQIDNARPDAPNGIVGKELQKVPHPDDAPGGSTNTLHPLPSLEATRIESENNIKKNKVVEGESSSVGATKEQLSDQPCGIDSHSVRPMQANDGQNLWSDRESQLRSLVGDGEFDTWLSFVERVVLIGNCVYLKVPSDQLRSIIEQKFAWQIAQALDVEKVIPVDPNGWAAFRIESGKYRPAPLKQE